jgi:hypothetical protein
MGFILLDFLLCLGLLWFSRITTRRHLHIISLGALLLAVLAGVVLIHILAAGALNWFLSEPLP